MTSPNDVIGVMPPGASDVLLRTQMPFFLRAVFAELQPGEDLVWDPYLDLICARLQAVARGEIRNLIINMPPRHLKSICVSVALPAFFLGQNPSCDVLAVSYGQELAKQFAEASLKVMTSTFYQRIFDTRLASLRQPAHAFRTTAGGIRRATSIDGAATGIGADLMIFDDPQKPNEVLSEALRRSSNQAYENTFLSRRNNPANCRTIIVMQRLHEDDFTGHVLGLGGSWEVLNLPAIAEEDEEYRYDTFMGSHVYSRLEGAALHPARLPLSELALLRSQMGESAWASQFMQRPAPAGGGIVNTAWFKRYADADRPTEFDSVLQSWDTAGKIALQNDFSACSTWGLKDKRIYLLDVFRGRLIYPDLKRKVVELARLHGATRVVIEDCASGVALLQDLRNENMKGLEPRKPHGDKQTRMAAQTAQIENGSVFIPDQAHWLAEYLHELAVFPFGKFDDQVDSTSQALDAIGNPQFKNAGLFEYYRNLNRASAERRGIVDTTPYWAPGSMQWAEQRAALAEQAALEGGLKLAA